MHMERFLRLVCVLIGMLAKAPSAVRGVKKAGKVSTSTTDGSLSRGVLPSCGEVMLRSVRSGRHLHVSEGTTSDGSPVIQHHSLSDGSRWMLEDAGENRIMLKNKRSGNYLHVYSDEQGEQVYQADSTAEGSVWIVENEEEDTFMLKSSLSGYYLHVKQEETNTGDPLFQKSSTSTGSIWQMDCTGDTSDYEGSIRVKVKPELCLSAQSGDLKEGDEIQLFKCSAAANEVFEFRSSDGTIRVKEKPELCLNAQSGELKEGDRIQLLKCSAAANEVFEFRISDGTIRVKEKPELCFNAKRGDPEEGDAIQLYECSAAPNEVFEFAPSPAPTCEKPDFTTSTSSTRGDSVSCGSGAKLGISFPGAMGPGTDTPGGRYGSIVTVTSLGGGEQEGTLRWALRKTDPRLIVFKVGGVIRLEAGLETGRDEGCLTVAGHSAPPPGITIVGHGLKIRGSDSIIRHIRVRPGDEDCWRSRYMNHACKGGGNIDAIKSSSGGDRIVFDHISAAWATDETVGAEDIRQITFSNSLIAQPLHHASHDEWSKKCDVEETAKKGKSWSGWRLKHGSCGPAGWSDYSDKEQCCCLTADQDQMCKYDDVQKHGYGSLLKYWSEDAQVGLHHNVYALTAGRTPRIGNEFAKTVVFHWVNNLVVGGGPGGGENELNVNWIGNIREYYEDDPGTRRRRNGVPFPGKPLFNADNNQSIKFYTSQNREKVKSAWDPRSKSDLWEGVGQDIGPDISPSQPFEQTGNRIVPESIGDPGDPVSSAQDLYTRLIDTAGAGRGAARDRVDSDTAKIVKAGVKAEIDAPGGCCIKSGEKCIAGDSAQPDDCDYESCLSDEYFTGSEENCKNIRKDGRSDDPYEDLNADNVDKSGAGVDWSREFTGTAEQLEACLENCIFPYWENNSIKCAQGSWCCAMDGTWS